ncbi:hypothetical protein RMATCC62417_05191 [Rhizopus microsporus]|nr:hypothetical protein RMATCC62417_05191 [Rhizopus microsporus]
MDDDDIDAMSIDSTPEIEIPKNETEEFEEMASDLGWYEYDAHEEEVFETQSSQDESVDGPVEVKLSNPVTDGPALEASFNIPQYAKKKGISREAFDSIIGMVNNHIKKHSPKAPLLYSHFKSRDRLIKKFPVKAKEHDVCKNGCELFGDDDGSDRCGECGEDKASAKKMKYLSLIEQLALLVSNGQTLELVKPSEKYEKDQDVLYDSFDSILGETLLKFYSNRKDRLVLYLGLYSNGFQVFKK